MRRNARLFGALLLVLCLGYACRTTRDSTVQAQAQPAPQFLYIPDVGFGWYYPDQKTVYVYDYGFNKCKAKLLLSTPGGPVAQSVCQ